MHKILYDARHCRLVYLDRAANEQFWDEKWEGKTNAVFVNPPRHSVTVRLTRRYLPPRARVLEGGCGLGDKVYALANAGFDAIGVDFAPRVVSQIKRNWPHLQVHVGDVRQLPFADATFDGYWSFGVIEHFFAGFDDISSEMRRVLRPGGYLFLTFPMMNLIRRYQARHNKYPLFDADVHNLQTFYQFALEPAYVTAKMREIGFAPVYSGGMSVRACLAEEFRVCGKVNETLDHLGVGAKVGRILDVLVGQHAGHSCLLVLRRIA